MVFLLLIKQIKFYVTPERFKKVRTRDAVTLLFELSENVFTKEK